MEHKSNSFRLRWLDLRKKWKSRRVEALGSNPKLKKQIAMWEILAKALPASALFVILIFYYSDLSSPLSYLMSAIAIAFSITAVIWWWWIMKMVGMANDITQLTLSRFEEIKTELTDIRKEINKKK